MDTRKKLKNIIPLFLILYVCLSLFPYTGREPQDKTFLWQVKAEKNTSYILGSIHFLKKEMFPLDTRIENAFEESNILVGEVDLTSAKLAEGTMMLLKKGRYPRRETLKENLSQETYDKARSKFEELGMDIMQFNSFKPWMVALSISAFELVKLGFDPNWGVDKYFMDRASGKKKYWK